MMDGEAFGIYRMECREGQSLGTKSYSNKSLKCVEQHGTNFGEFEGGRKGLKGELPGQRSNMVIYP